MAIYGYFMNLIGYLRYIIHTRTFRKHDFILVSAYGINSIQLHGLIEYLGDFFRVHFIDLPGFRADIPPLPNISIAEYTRYVESKVSQLNLKSYFLGGISFGFLVANKLPPDPRVRGIIAIEPYINADAFRWNTMEITFLSSILGGIEKLHLADAIWHNTIFRIMLKLFSRVSFGTIDQILRQDNADAFFQTAKQLLTFRSPVGFHDIPYVLVINTPDDIIQTDWIVSYFRRHARELFVIEMHTVHYPDVISRKLVSEWISRDDIYAMIRWANRKK
jgi:pimeloyl-ACP methyl ester carboxylesterase